MVNLKSQPKSSKPREEKEQKVAVLRWGHRPQRDVRLTTHVALSARAFGACRFMLVDAMDEGIRETVERVSTRWGGDFAFEMGTKWKAAVRDWKAADGVVVHLTAYGENIQASDVLERIRATQKPVLVLVGSQKVPREFYSPEVSDFNVAVGNQPHSECAALAVFLDRLFRGKLLDKSFKNAKIRIIPQERGKKVE